MIYKPTKKGIAVIGIGSLLIVGAVVLFVVLQPGKPATTKIVLGSGSSATTFKLEKVSDSQGQVTGLSGRTSLPENTGILFDYEGGVTQRCIWMKDMQFSIDVIWLNADHRVTSIVPNLAPGTYPQQYCADAKYMIELSAGQAAARGLRIGQIIEL